jgi:RHS repeat-associated protein
VDQGGTVIATYTYNALGQRIGVDDAGTQTWTVYNGNSADASPYSDFNGSGSVTERYLFGPTVVNGAVTAGILARTNSSGTTDWNLTDDLGSVRDIVSTSGTDLDHIVYDPFGNVLSQSDSAYGDRFMFAGMQYDATTGQYYDHARNYDSVIGRFISQDPMGFSAGDTDIYRYVENDAPGSTDTSGDLQGQMQMGFAPGPPSGMFPYCMPMALSLGFGPCPFIVSPSFVPLYPVSPVYDPATMDGTGHGGFNPGKVTFPASFPRANVLIKPENGNFLMQVPPGNVTIAVDAVYVQPCAANPTGVIKVPDGYTIGMTYIPMDGYQSYYYISRQWFAWQAGGDVRLVNPSDPNIRFPPNPLFPLPPARRSQQ